ncbi:MAG TPA: hypothetical protein PKW33_21605 [Anaerolineaceae bacterium]|nr:hypothetical protein [Anaerolineaceae bacterium]HPN54206.1 hypothetical protein [Anaerolineaceae bacterium]
MTTRAGLAGIITGVIITLVVFFPMFWYQAFGAAYLLAGILALAGGFWAGRWSGSVQPWRCAVLGGVAGGTAGTLVFCWVGAAAAGLAAAPVLKATHELSVGLQMIVEVINQTGWAFLTWFLGGLALGALGGWHACQRKERSQDVFDKSEPQMALNTTITAVCASVVTAVMAAAVFGGLEKAFGATAAGVLGMPLTVSLVMTLISQLALTLVIPHEAAQAEHRCGMDEVKMAAFVGIGTAPLLALLLGLVDARLLLTPVVTAALLLSAAMSGLAGLHLFKKVLPGRAAFPVPQDSRQKAEAVLFGTIANSLGPRLVVLCTGCGLLMVLPLQAAVFSALINLNYLMLDAGQTAGGLYLAQALISTGLMAGVVAILSLMYLFYLNLGRWFSRWSRRRP